LEEERFTAYLLRAWHAKKSAAVKTPDYVRDNMPVDLLAEVYTRFADRVVSQLRPELRTNPSGFIESQGAFAHRVAREVRKRLHWPCELDLACQKDFSEPFMRMNFEPATLLVPEWSETGFWDSFVEFYANQLSQPPTLGTV
jgi:UDP-glucose 4-epimerase